jgi:hypothetical protein
MRDLHTIEREIDTARFDLEQALGRLRSVVMAKLDIKARVRDAIERRKARTRRLVAMTTQGARAYPAVAVLAVAVAAMLLYVRRRARRR